MKTNSNINPLYNLDHFVDSLQKEDSRYQKMTLYFHVIMWVLAAIYGIIFLVNPDPEIKLTERIGGLCFALSFMIFALIFNKLNNEYRYIDYGLPVTEMLKSAIKRYSLSHKKLLMVIVPVLLTDAAMVLLTVDHRKGTITEQIIWVQEILIPAILFGACLGISIWYIRKKPLRDAAITLLKEIES